MVDLRDLGFKESRYSFNADRHRPFAAVLGDHALRAGSGRDLRTQTLGGGGRPHDHSLDRSREALGQEAHDA